jgi:hypothetical protein
MSLFNRTVITFFAVIIPLQATDYYIDQKFAGAGDQNNGSIAQPWKTITKANQTLLPGDTVQIKAGTFNTTIAPVNSGKADMPILQIRIVYPGVILYQYDCSYCINCSSGNGHEYICRSDKPIQ